MCVYTGLETHHDQYIALHVHLGGLAESVVVCTDMQHDTDIHITDYEYVP